MPEFEEGVEKAAIIGVAYWYFLMSRSLKVSPQFVSQVKAVVKRQGYPRQKDLADELQLSLATVSNYLNGKPVDNVNFQEISERLEQDWPAIALFEDTTDRLPEDDSQSASQIPVLDNPSLVYIERPPIESSCLKAIAYPGALLRIKSPRLMGKTTLMARILAQRSQEGDRCAYLNFHLANETDFARVDTFLKWFCISFGQSLGIPNKLAEYWDEEFSTAKVDSTDYVQNYLLANIKTPVILCLDEVDRLFPYPQVASEFLGLLRAWHERGKVELIWQKLRLVVVHSTEVYIPLNINESPFNVGVPIELPELTLSQVQEFAEQHQQNWSESALQQLMEMVGGHPYLIEQAFSQYSPETNDRERLLQDAPTEAGIYANQERIDMDIKAYYAECDRLDRIPENLRQ
ncbi:AAA-like domain-containing protein [Roseofilum casamattae]|uniref:AAA-like domain-containing protein n=1 Tax=Roseofilum casamattae BLCC-M143 TaxID=3022442 RepID=A0ABT7BR85_9CYAN|nr:AAA-like domain-containing protein [Roseofilum casamattae]MDJ1181707.1 AAA-like domain-containing protein [Roseofilum casamattae BLCC-M143]